ncbi:MAG TPA: HDIG domain-containing protein [Verrucomicrobiae bacterium]|nr:HDIG domain-containing protein [Verrucomicrobiae bacterium]
MEKELDPQALERVRAQARELYETHIRRNPVQTLTRTREESLAMLESWVSSDALRKHMLSVEAAMTAYAHKFSEDVALWGATGLLHDFDYEKNPTIESHVLAGIPVLTEAGYPAPMLDAIMGHADYFDLPRETKLAKTLFAVDELCGFLTAVAYVRPTKSLAAIEFSSINKKLKDKAFARAVSRDDIRKGAGELGVDFQEHVRFVARALQQLESVP